MSITAQHWIVPALLGPWPESELPGFPLPNLPQLNRARRQSGLAGSDWCMALSTLCSLGSQLPAGGLGAPIEGLEDGHWLRADPVHLRIETNGLTLWPIRNLDRDEAAAYSGALQRDIFDARGLTLAIGRDPSRWYVRIDTNTPPLVPHPPSTASLVGQNIASHLPPAWWSALQTEIQLHLNVSPLNHARTEQDRVPLNALWFWGAEALPSPPKPFAAICGEDFEVEALAAYFGATQQATTTDSALVLDLKPWQAWQNGDPYAWQQAVETVYHALPWPAIRAGRLGLTLSSLDGQALYLDWRAPWRVWKPSQLSPSRYAHPSASSC